MKWFARGVTALALCLMAGGPPAASAWAQEDVDDLFGEPVCCDDPFGAEAPAEEAPAGADPFGQGEGQQEKKPETTAPQPANSGTPEAEAASAPPSKQFEIELIDGSRLQGEIDIAEIDVVTKYGALKIPLAELQSISPGLATQRVMNERVMGMIERLGGDKFQEREQAQVELVAMGTSVRGLLQTAAASDNVERSKRAQTILEKFAELERTWGPSPAKPLAVHDEITTTQFTATGQVQVKIFTVHGLYGTVQVQLEHIKSLRRASAVKAGEIYASANVTGENIANIKTFESSIIVNRGDMVSIRAGGIVKRSGTAFRPEGNSDYGQFDRTGIMTGALLVQVGTDGERKLAGSKCTFTADADGPLHFSIGMPANYARSQFEGQYEVQVRVTSSR